MQRRRCKGLAEIFNMLREPGGRLFVPVRRTDDLCRLRSVFSSTALAHSARHKVQELRCQIKTQIDVVIFCTDRRLYCSTLNYSSLFIIICFVLKNGRHVSAKEYHGVNLAVDFLGETYIFGQTVFDEAWTVETTKKGSLTEEIKIFSFSMKSVPLSVGI